MHVRMMMQVLAPGMQNAEKADLGAEVFGVAGDGEQRFRSGAEQGGIHDGLVLIGDGGGLLRHGEHNMKVLDGEQFTFALLEPLGALFTLAFRAMAIAAGVIADANVLALATLIDMAAEGRRPAVLDGARISL